MKIARIAVLLILAASLPALAQLELPAASPEASLSQTIGNTDITIEYHRPGVKARTIWGGLVPYDTPWRMGANEATTIEFSDPVKVEGQDVPAGKYSFFAIPGRDAWTMIINKDPNQWGAFGYDQAKDQVRATIRPVASAHNEWMRFTIDPVTPSSALVTLHWEKVAIPVRVEVDVPKLVWSDVDRALASTYSQAAAWSLESGQRLDEGLRWADQSIAAGENIFNLWTKARLLQKLGRSREAVPVMEKSLSLARSGEMPQEFLNILQGTLDSIRADAR